MNEKASPSLSLKRRIVFSLTLLIILGMFSFVLLEVAARILDPLGISYYPETAAYMDTLIVEEPIGYRNQPNLSGVFYGQDVEINAIGLRHQAVDPIEDPEKFRILLLGDSVVFGVGVSGKDTLPSQLEKLLRKRFGDVGGREIEVINMGCISYNTEQELIQYQQLGKKFAADVVLLMFSENDIEPKMWIFNKRSNPVVRLGQKSYAVSLLYVLKRQLTKPPLIQSGSYSAQHPRWDSIDSAMTKLRGQTAQADIPFVVFTRSDKKKSWPLLNDLANRESFQLRLLMPFSDPRWDNLKAVDFMVPGGGGHFDAEGLAMYATLMMEDLDELGLLKDLPD